jgi:hypothetical protein
MSREARWLHPDISISFCPASSWLLVSTIATLMCRYTYTVTSAGKVCKAAVSSEVNHLHTSADVSLPAAIRPLLEFLVPREGPTSRARSTAYGT